MFEKVHVRTTCTSLFEEREPCVQHNLNNVLVLCQRSDSLRRTGKVLECIHCTTESVQIKI